MGNRILRLMPWLVATLMLVLAWAFVIMIALQVSQTILDTLHAIVELADISPPK